MTIFNERVLLDNDPKIVPPSKWHVLYWLKWQFVVKPKLLKAMNKAKAEVIDELLHSEQILARATRNGKKWS